MRTRTWDYQEQIQLAGRVGLKLGALGLQDSSVVLQPPGHAASTLLYHHHHSSSSLIVPVGT